MRSKASRRCAAATSCRSSSKPSTPSATQASSSTKSQAVTIPNQEDSVAHTSHTTTPSDPLSNTACTQKTAAEIDAPQDSSSSSSALTSSDSRPTKIALQPEPSSEGVDTGMTSDICGDQTECEVS